MSARITFVFLALVVGILCLTATHAGPPSLKIDAAKPVVQAEVWKSTFEANHGRIGRLIAEGAHGGGILFTLVGGQTAMEPRRGLYSLTFGHPNYQAIYDLLYKAAENRWKVRVRTKDKLDKHGDAMVVHVAVNFPADAPSPEVASDSLTAPPPVGSGGPRLEMGSYVLPCERRPTGKKFQEISVHHVTFKRPFAAPPRILLSPRGLAIYSGANVPGTFFQLYTRNVSKEGFDLVIQGAYARSFSSATVDWIAVGS